MRAKILAVDDEILNLEILGELLEDDYDVVMVESGEACLQSVAQERPDIILLDVNMPGLNGLEVCRQLKQNHETNDIPILFLSALSRKEEVERGEAAGADGYISKPFRDDELYSILEKFLPNK